MLILIVQLSLYHLLNNTNKYKFAQKFLQAIISCAFALLATTNYFEGKIKWYKIQIGQILLIVSVSRPPHSIFTNLLFFRIELLTVYPGFNGFRFLLTFEKEYLAGHQ